MEMLQEFLASPHSDLIMLVGGGLLSLVGFYQVVKKGFSLFFWLLLFGIGLFPVIYVFKGSEADFLTEARNQVADIGNLTAGVGDDVLKVWCDKLDEAGR